MNAFRLFRAAATGLRILHVRIGAGGSRLCGIVAGTSICGRRADRAAAGTIPKKADARRARRLIGMVRHHNVTAGLHGRYRSVRVCVFGVCRSVADGRGTARFSLSILRGCLLMLRGPYAPRLLILRECTWRDKKQRAAGQKYLFHSRCCFEDAGNPAAQC